MTTWDQFRLCRFCQTLARTRDELVKYEVRHYAHPACLLEAHGRDAFLRLPTWKLTQLPYQFLKTNGLLELVEARVAQEEAR